MHWYSGIVQRLCDVADGIRRHGGSIFIALLLSAFFLLAGCSDRSESSQFAGEIATAELPAEARAIIAVIRRGGPFAHDKDGSIFFNRENLLPAAPRGYYREYTVPTPGVSHRGARRIVSGGQGEMYYTADHYRSFRRILE